MNERDFQLNPFVERFNEYISKINESLSREIESYSWSEFYLPLKYACHGGKRIRPMILLTQTTSEGAYLLSMSNMVIMQVSLPQILF